MSAARGVPTRQHCTASAMNDTYRSPDGLGRVLRDAVEGRGRPAAGPAVGAGVGRRAFISTLESRPPASARQPFDRPRFGAIVLAAVLCLAAAAALALVPAITGHGSHPSAGKPAPAAQPVHWTAPASVPPLTAPGGPALNAGGGPT